MNIDVKDLEIPAIDIPNKSLFKMNEVCGLTGVKPYVLRFWESEFEEINPMTSSTGQKLFEHKDIESILIIKNLLFEKKLTIEQAKAVLKLHSYHLESTHIEEEIHTSEKEELINEVEEEDYTLLFENIPRSFCFVEDIPVIEQTVSATSRKNYEVDENLIMARARLKKMIGRAQEVSQRHGWH